VIEWQDDGGNVIVRRAAKLTMTDVHRALFRGPQPRKTDEELREGVRAQIRRKHARR
jgi:hypothetical protein